MNNTITTHYRVVATTTIGFGADNFTTSYPWIGIDIDELSRLYPPSDIHGADPLFHHEIEGGYIRTDYVFERMLADNSWEKIADPRRRLTPVTVTERAIDAENRRDFPGDYITSDCDNCGDYGCEECDYRVRCNECRDDGCAKCDPSWCKACSNNGCASCDPRNVCTDCKEYIDSQDGDTIDQNGRCTGCAYQASRRFCTNCKDELSDEHEGDLCTNCKADLQPRCCDCNEPLTDPNQVNEGIHKECADYWRELDKPVAWWRRLLRWCMFWR